MIKKIINYPFRNNQLNRPPSKKLVLAGGCFDIIHIGHIRFLQKAKSCGDMLAVALESDQFIKIHKKRTPWHNQRQRAEILACLSVVDYVLIIPYLKGYQQYLELVQKVKPDVIAVTRSDPQIKNKLRQAGSINAKLIVASGLIANHSTSKLIKKIGF